MRLTRTDCCVTPEEGVYTGAPLKRILYAVICQVPWFLAPGQLFQIEVKHGTLKRTKAMPSSPTQWGSRQYRFNSALCLTSHVTLESGTIL